MGEVPRIFFVKDKYYSKAAEIDVLLSKADFGEDFIPTDPTLFMKTKLELQMKLSDDVREKIQELEQNLDEDEIDEDELPEMRNDVLGLDHSLIMKRIATSMDKTKRAWETFETKSENIMSSEEPKRDFVAAQGELDKFSMEAEHRDDFIKFLEKKQWSKRGTPERKKHKSLSPDDDEHIFEEYRDSTDEDYLEDDHDHKK